MVSLPEYQLFCQAVAGNQQGRWRFVLRPTDGTPPLEVEDVDPTARGERLELLGVVRALEALDQPSRVVLVNASTYVREGICYGVEEWRANDWQWESFGKMTLVKNADLWRRVHRALQFHRVEFRTWRIDRAHVGAPALHVADRTRRSDSSDSGQAEAAEGFRPRFQRLLGRAWPRITLAARQLDRVACL
ncbi:MAG TPA: RNase H family protein [Thermoguttaceae bacterium]|nr:RNase H family protein [Thermoguttaceae bacterium]